LFCIFSFYIFCGLTGGAADVRNAAATRRQSRAISLRVMGYGLEPHYDI